MHVPTAHDGARPLCDGALLGAGHVCCCLVLFHLILLEMFDIGAGNVNQLL